MNNNRSDPLSARSVQSTINRSEREVELLRQSVQRIKDDRDHLQQHLEQVSEAKERCDDQIVELNAQVVQLQSDNRDLQLVQGPSKSTISLLREENNQLKAENRTLTSEVSKLKVSRSQLKWVSLFSGIATPFFIYVIGMSSCLQNPSRTNGECARWTSESVDAQRSAISACRIASGYGRHKPQSGVPWDRRTESGHRHSTYEQCEFAEGKREIGAWTRE